MLQGLPILNPFPDLLILGSLAPFILRFVLGIIAVNSGILKTKDEKARWIETLRIAHIPEAGLVVVALGIIEIITGAMLIVGLYTQVAALIYGIIALICLYAEYRDSALVKRDLVFYVLIVSISLSLLLSGAGSFSLDLPL